MQPTPLRKDLVSWCGYHYDDARNIWYRKNGKVCLRYFEPDLQYPAGRWFAYLIAGPDQENPFLCEVESLGRLTLLCLALDGDALPLIINIPKEQQ